MKTLPESNEPVAWGEFVDIACARIKAADDAAAGRDYMLDSDDCIKVLRGEWKAPVLNDQPTKPKATPPQPKEPEQEPLISKDAYDGAREDLAIWKKRALEAEELNRKFIAEINGPTHMGEPVRPEQKPVTPFGLPLFWDAPAPFPDGSLINEGTKNIEQEPVEMYRRKCADGSRCLHGCHTNEPCYTTPPQRKPKFKEFIEWAGSEGYDCAQTCNSDTGEWICLNPMTADLWKAWQAAHGISKGEA